MAFEQFIMGRRHLMRNP